MASTVTGVSLCGLDLATTQAFQELAAIVLVTLYLYAMLIANQGRIQDFKRGFIE